MDPLRIFVPLAKADAAQRLVYGYFDETPDRAGEVFDYASSKPNIEAWSAEMSKASDGKSLGNIRGQHSNIAAGKLVELTFDDDLKKVGFVAKVVDDNEWKKVEEGVYTGFSPGGRYAKRWQDGAHKRYTADVRELSIVDVPCNPSATFTMVKADGTEETREFAIGNAYEPGNTATVERADALAKAAGKPDRRNDFVVQARAELIAENAADALAKMASDDEPAVPADPAAALSAALAKAAAVPTTPANAPKIPAPYVDLAKAGAALKLIAAATVEQPVLAKGMWQVERTACLLDRVADIASSVSWEESAEGDTDSKLPQMAIDLVTRIKTFLVEMANEEVAELLATISERMPDFALVLGDDAAEAADETMELAAQIVDLVKADADLMEKAGARNSKADAAMIQTMHDHSVKLGADCGGDANKDALTAIEADRDRLAKALNDAAPQVVAITDRLEKAEAGRAEAQAELAKANARIAELEALPEPPKGKVVVMEKQVGGADTEAVEPIAAVQLDDIRALPVDQKLQKMEELAIQRLYNPG